MNDPLVQMMIDRISSGLKRKAITTCSKWTEKYRIMGQPFPGPWRFDRHPWTRAMHDCEEELIVGQKSAQMGYTETALNKVFFNIDIRGVSCLYVLPNSKPDASDFSTARFDPALEASEHLRNMFSDVKNIGHKRAGMANLYVCGSRSRPQLKSKPVGLVILDEVDEMEQVNVPMSFERMSGHEKKQSFLLSTPTIEKFGINSWFQNSTQQHFFFKCPHCSKYIELMYPDNIVITAEDINDIKIRNTHLICNLCKGRLEHEDKINWLSTGEWHNTHDDKIYTGFYVNQFYSTTIKPYELAISYLKSLSDPAEEQEFFNSKLGMPHTVEGAQVRDTDIQKCTSAYKMFQEYRDSGLVTMGVDVGKWLHYEIDLWQLHGAVGNDVNILAVPKILAVGKVLEFEELGKILRQYNVVSCVIDANPERRKALEFANEFYGRVKLCTYGNAITGKQLHTSSEEYHSVTVDRTSWLDLSLGRFIKQNIVIPVNLPFEYKEHIKTPVRIYEKDDYGNLTGKYVKGGGDDHYAHARNYAEIALPYAVGMGVSRDI